MKRILFFMCFFFSFQMLFAQYDFDLVKSFPINGNVYNNEKIWLKDNTFLVPINFSTQNYTLDNGTLIPNPNYQANSQQTKILILHYNEDAQLLDHFTLNSSGYEYLRDLTLDENDNMYLSIDVNPGYQLDGVQYFLNSTNTLQKHLLLKVTSTRNPSDNSITRTVTWKKRIEGNTGIPSIVISSTDNIYFSTKIDQSSLIVDGIIYSNPTPHQSQSFLARMVVGKFNKGGLGLDWITSSTNSTSENFQNPTIFNISSPFLRLDSQENLYIVNILYGTKTVFGSTILNNSLASNNPSLFMVKYSSNGQLLWAKIPSTSNSSLRLFPTQFEIDQYDNLYLLEQFHPGYNGAQQVNYWGNSYTSDLDTSHLIKLDSNGNVIWFQTPEISDLYNHIYSIESFKIINNKILAFGLIKGLLDFGNGFLVDTDQDTKWIGMEFETNNGGMDSYNLLDTSAVVSPYNLFGIDSNNRLWFSQKTYFTGTYNLFIGSTNYNISTNGVNQRMILYRTTGVTLGNQNHSELSFAIYPNPTTDVIHIQGEILSNYKYQIIDMLGRIQKKGDLNTQDINVHHLASGTYLLKILDQSDVSIQQTLKFVKK